MLSLLYCTTLTSVHNYWKNHSFDYTDLCWQSVREQFLGPHRWGRNEVRPSSNLDIKSGLEPGPGILSRTVKGLHRVWAALGRQGAGCCWMTMAFLENLGEVQNWALSLSTRWTWTKSLLNGCKVPSGLLPSCLCSSLCYFGANYAVCWVSLLPDLKLPVLWPFACLLFLSVDRGQPDKASDFNQPSLPLVSISRKIFTECFIFSSQGFGHPGVIYGFHYPLFPIHYYCEELRFAYIPNIISSLQRGPMP